MVFNYRTEYNRYRRYFTSLEPLAKTPIIRAYFSLIASLFALSFFGAFAIRPTIKTIIGLRKEITDASFTDKRLQEKINALSEAQTQYSLIQPELPTVFAALPKNPEFSSLLKQIENIVVASGASISAIQFQSVTLHDAGAKEKQISLQASPSGTEKNNTPDVNIESSDKLLGLTPISFSLILRGSYTNLTAFLTSLTRLSRLIHVDSFVISTVTGGFAELSLNIQTKAFYYE
jgi:Tfp pilus assembly protein PilO